MIGRTKMIIITRRELTNAFKTLVKAAEYTPRNNSHRLLLFYAVECGLKSLYLKRIRKDVIDGATANQLGGHNLNKAMSELRFNDSLHLPKKMSLSDINQNQSRQLECGKLNEVWRYGASLTGTYSDQDLEAKLENVITKIKGEI